MSSQQPYDYYNQSPQPQEYPPYQPPPQPESGRGLALAGLILGIISIIV